MAGFRQSALCQINFLHPDFKILDWGVNSEFVINNDLETMYSDFAD